MNGDNSSRFQSGAPSGAMSLGNNDLRFHTAKQGELAFNGSEPSNLNDDLLVRSTISASIRNCAKSREQISEEMTALLDVRVTEKMLNTYSAEAMQANRFPAAWDRAFCRAVGSDALLRCRAEAAGYRLIRGEEIFLLELGRQMLRAKRANEEAALLEKRLQGASEI